MPQLKPAKPQPIVPVAAPIALGVRGFAALAVLAVLGVIVYSNSFSAPLVFDWEIVARNFSAGKIWPWQLAIGQNRPVGFLSFALNYVAQGDRVWSYHAVNLAIHVAAAWVLYAIVCHTLSRPPLAQRYHAAAGRLALAAAAIWLVHPLQTESVTYIYQRLESLMSLFYLLTLYCFIRGQQSSRPAAWYAASAIACALGMGTKEVMVSAPLAVLWYDRALVASSFQEILRRRWKYYAALAGTWGILAGLMLNVTHYEHSGVLIVQGVTPLDYALTQPGVLLHYLKLCFWPSELCIDYAWPLAKSFGQIVPPGLALVALLAATLWCLFRRPALGFLAGSFFLILGPTSSIAPLADLAVEHRMYLPLAAVVVLVVVFRYEAWLLLAARFFPAARTPSKLRAFLAMAILLPIVAALGARTMLRNEDYGSAHRLWEETVRTAPKKARAHSNLAAPSTTKGDSTAAEGSGPGCPARPRLRHCL